MPCHRGQMLLPCQRVPATQYLRQQLPGARRLVQPPWLSLIQVKTYPEKWRPPPELMAGQAYREGRAKYPLWFGKVCSGSCAPGSRWRGWALGSRLTAPPSIAGFTAKRPLQGNVLCGRPRRADGATTPGCRCRSRSKSLRRGASPLLRIIDNQTEPGRPLAPDAPQGCAALRAPVLCTPLPRAGFAVASVGLAG